MVDDKSEDGAPAEPSRPRREPPTIDLTATDVSDAPTAEAKESKEAEQAAAEPALEAAGPSEPNPKPISPWAIAPISGAVAATLVIGVGWMLGWPAVQTPAPAPQFNAAAIDDLTARIAGLESKASKPATAVADPAAAARLEGIEKSVAALRNELATTRAQADRLASAVNDIKAQPRGDGSTPAAVDLSPLNERLAQIERAAKAQETEIAAVKSAAEKAADTKPADDAALRRVVASSLLDVAVRHGDPFAAQLAAAKSLAPNADALKALDTFAASGVPSAPALCRELVAIVPKLAPPAADTESAGSGIVDRLKAG